MNLHNLDKFNYDLPEALIASHPADPRDSSKLMVVRNRSVESDRGHILKPEIDVFRNISKYLPTKCLFVLNKTKVIPARVELVKDTGGSVEVLFLTNEVNQSGIIRGMVDRKVKVGQKLMFKDGSFLVATIQDKNIFTFNYEFSQEELINKLYRYGSTPIPKYIQSDISEADLRVKYQSVFANKIGSVAAPTASLHFTESLINDLRNSGHDFAEVVLHVGLGTFAPLTEENFQNKKLHKEHFEISEADSIKIKTAKESGVPIIVVGTTALRAVESAYSKILDGVSVDGYTDIFIFGRYNFRIADGLITNFHIPKSSLMCLVDSFIISKNEGRDSDIVGLYNIAIKDKFRFYSFGDAMLIL
jgi:S-adenosylmethionine:tRNA ribosyltransferase-isomerase